MIGRGLRYLVVRGCTVAGGFLGLLLALKDYCTHSQRVPSACHTHAHAYAHAHVLAHTFAQCIGTDLEADILSLVLPLGLGLLDWSDRRLPARLDDPQRTRIEKELFRTRSLKPSRPVRESLQRFC
jgi:hypothetical protein